MPTLPSSTPQEDPAPEGTGRQLWYAADSGQVAQVQALCERWGGHGQVINWANPDDNGQTPLHATCDSDSPQCTAILVSTRGIDVNKGDNDGFTPLWYAAYNGLPETVQALLADKDIDLNKAPTVGNYLDSNNISHSALGKSPLVIAKDNPLGKGGCEAVVTLLEAPPGGGATSGGKKNTKKSKKIKKNQEKSRKTKKTKSSYKRLTKKTK